MYYEFFGLNDAPFKITPNLGLFYSGSNRGAILDALQYAISSGEGIIKVIGEVGSGKTMLCRMLADRLPDSIATVYIANPSLSRDELLYTIAHELGFAPENPLPTLFVRRLQDRLIEMHTQGRQAVVFIDEAQAMPLAALEEIRLLSNLETGTHKLLQIVLFGQPELDKHLNVRHIRQLNERITYGFKLAPFGPENTGEYLNHRLRAVGYRGPDLFPPKAIALIAKASRGLARRINILADKTLLAAYAENAHTIRLDHVRTALRDSRYRTLLLPWLKYGLVALGSAAATVVALSFSGPRVSALLSHLGGGAPPPRVSTSPISAAPAPAATVPASPQHPALLPAAPAPADQAPRASGTANAPPASPSQATGHPASPVATAASPSPSATPAARPVTQAIPAAAEYPAPAAAARPPATLEERSAALAALLAGNGKNKHYTLQISLIDGGDSPHAGAEIKALAKLLPGQPVFAYPTEIKDKRYIALTLGDFTGFSQAKEAIAALPASYQARQPVTRSFGGIRKELDGAHIDLHQGFPE
ncbi:MAG: AAA family ATPase [Burkholderiales bacterium]